MSQRRLIVYVREGCGLCEEMLEGLMPLQQEFGFALDAIDVDSAPALVEAYGDRVPVLVAGQTELGHYFLDPQQVRLYFAAS